MGTFTVTLEANKEVVIPETGRYIRIISGSASLAITPDTDAQITGFEVGMGWTADKPFKKLRLLSETLQTVQIMIVNGRIDDDRANIDGDIDATSKGATLSNAAHTVGVAAAELLAADNTRRSVVIQNLSAGDIYIGSDNTVTILNGLKIGTMQNITLDKAAPSIIYAIGSGAGLDVRTFEELD
jgi:hypothetical protein